VYRFGDVLARRAPVWDVGHSRRRRRDFVVPALKTIAADGISPLTVS
jgi:hypothetical protein